MIERQLGRWEEVFVVNNKRNQLKIIGIKVLKTIEVVGVSKPKFINGGCY